MKKLAAHLFICTNARDATSCCAQKDALAIHAAVKEACNRPDWQGLVRINRSGCLGRCENGAVAVLYPEGRWFHRLGSGDVPLLVAAVEDAVNKAK